MDVILSAIKLRFAIIYHDDIVVITKFLEEHAEHSCNVITLLSNARVILKLKKFRFSSETIKYIGHVICPRRLKFASHTTDATRELRTPTF